MSSILFQPELFHPEDTELLFESGSMGAGAVSVIITCYKYGRPCIEALESVARQTEQQVDVVILDDCSPDDSAEVVLNWLKRDETFRRFNYILLLRHKINHGLSQARNTAAARVRTPYIFILDGDNQIYPRALSVLRAAIENSGCAMAYSLIERFGDERGIFGNSTWIPEKFAFGNYIDAMALIRTDVLAGLNGYRIMPNKFGWEDYDLWCSFIDKGLRGCHVPQILCRYRVHGKSMLRMQTGSFIAQNRELVRADLELHHSFKFR